MKTRLQEYYDYVLGDLGDFKKHLDSFEKKLQEEEHKKNKRLEEYKSKGGAYFEKRVKKGKEEAPVADKQKKVKTIEDKKKEYEEKIIQDCKNFFENLIPKKNEKQAFRKLLRSWNKSQLEVVLFGNNTDDLENDFKQKEHLGDFPVFDPENIQNEFIIFDENGIARPYVMPPVGTEIPPREEFPVYLHLADPLPLIEPTPPTEPVPIPEPAPLLEPAPLAELPPLGLHPGDLMPAELKLDGGLQEAKLLPQLSEVTLRSLSSNEELRALENILAPPEDDEDKEIDGDNAMAPARLERKRHSLKRIKIPNDETLLLIFKKWEEKFHYFDNEADKVFEKFKAFYKICKMIGDYTDNSSDIDIVSQAYKMLVLFGDEDNPNKYFNSIDNYLKKFYAHERHPLHEALQLPLPINGKPAKIDLPKWREIIKSAGPTAFMIFNKAAEIEDKLKRAPASYDEAYEVSKKMRYKNADLNPLIADLCLTYHLSERLFDKCLRIFESKKTVDNLPKISIDGSKMGHPGYHLIKLPIDDPNAFVLGYITKCCQSIGGHSERCVIDGIQRANNGFYVMLKEKKPELKPRNLSGEQKPLLENGKINYANFDIVGQGYAWLSVDNNLVFDSWENARPAYYLHARDELANEATDQKATDLRDDGVIVPLLTQFAKEITAEEKFNILRVTIGTGGKTPEAFTNAPILPTPEIMLEGEPYGDSAEQNLVFCNVALQEKLFNDLKEILKQSLPVPNKIDEILSDLSLKQENIYSAQQIKNLTKVLADPFIKTNLSNDKNIKNLQAIFQLNGFALNSLLKVSEEKLLNDNTFALMMSQPDFVQEIATSLINLNNNGLLNDEIFKIISVNSENTDKVTLGLITLKNANMLNDFSIENVIKQFPSNSHLISENWIKLSNNGIISELKSLNLLTLENLRILLINSTNEGYIDEITGVLPVIKKINKLDDKAFEMILESPSKGFDINTLYEAKVFDELLPKIMSKTFIAPLLTSAIAKLYESRLADKEFIEEIFSSSDCKQKLLSCALELNKEGLLNKQTLDILKHSDNQLNVTKAIIILNQAKLLNHDNLEKCVNFVERLSLKLSWEALSANSEIIPACEAWIILNKLQLLTDKNCDLLIKMVKKSQKKTEEVMRRLEETINAKGDLSALDISERQKIFENIVQSESMYAKLSLFKKSSKAEEPIPVNTNDMKRPEI